ncbi:MAG: TIM barrel protein [Planctomycetota bacterium]|jgi:sugar phosphate isomerase/epimerase
MIKSCVTISLVPSLSGGPWVYWDELEVSIAKAKTAGFDAVEVFTASADAVNSDLLSAILNEHDLKLAAVGTGAGRVLHGLHLTHPDKAIREKAINFIGRMITFGARFGAPVIIGSMQGSVEQPVGKKQSMAWLAEGLNRLGQKAAECGVKLILEPLNRYETNLVNRLADAVELVESLQANNVLLLADLFHMNIEEDSIAGSIRAAAKHIEHVHFVDSNRRPAGMGHIDMAEIGRVLNEIGFDGYASAEAFAYPDPDRAAAQTIAAFNQFMIPPFR